MMTEKNEGGGISRRAALGGMGAPFLALSAARCGLISTNKKLRVGVIGRTGRGDYGHGLDTAWKSVPETEIVAVADENEAGLARAKARLEVGSAFRDYREMLRKVPIDIVAVCPRWVDEHRDMAVAALERGIHVFMEKPMCRTLREADEMVDLCKKKRVKLAVAHPTRYSPKFETVKKLIKAGAIGRVLEYRARGKEDHRGGGEDLWVLGSHMMDLIRGFAGGPRWCFASVTESGRPIRKRHVVEGKEGLGPLAGDSIQAVFGLRDGSTAFFGSQRGMAGNPRRFGLQIFGSRGVIEILEDAMPSVKILQDPSWSPARSGKSWQDVSSQGIGVPETLDSPEHRTRHGLAIRDLLRAIEEDRDPICSAVEARGSVEMILAVFESQRLGKPVDLPLENREHPLTMID